MHIVRCRCGQFMNWLRLWGGGYKCAQCGRDCTCRQCLEVVRA
jgi:hypothetical protein